MSRDLDARIRAIEARTFTLPTAALESRVVAVEQGLWQLWQAEHAAAASGCDRTWSLTVTGCAGLPLDGVGVEIRDFPGTVLASGTTDGAGLLTLTTSQAASPGDDYVYLTGSHPRWGSGGVTLSGLCAATTAVPVAFALSPAVAHPGCSSDYFCLDAGCARPLSMSQSLFDPYFGVTVPLFWGGCPAPGGTRSFVGAVAVPYAAYLTCPARASVTLDWTVDYESGTITVEHRGTIAGCPLDTGGTIYQLTWDMDLTCPTEADFTLLNTGIHFNAGGSKLYAGTTPAPVVTEV